MAVCTACSALLLALTFGTSLSQVGKLVSRHPDKTVGEAKIPKPLGFSQALLPGPLAAPFPFGVRGLGQKLG